MENHIITFDEFVNESAINEGNLPPHVLAIAKKHSPDMVEVVKDVAKWAAKAGVSINGGTAIGKNYSTVILDINHQGSEIYINLDNDTIELYGEEITDAADFKRVFDANK